MNNVVVFDFDGTLIKGDSFIMFARKVSGAFRLAKAIALEAAVLAGWKLGFVNNGYAKERLFSRLFKGDPLQQMEAWGAAFVADLESRTRPEIIGKLEAHLGKGDKVYIISASMQQWIRPWAEVHGIRNVLSTEPETDSGGFLTGRFSTPNCYGQEKVRRLLAAEPERGSYRLTVYGDSKGDAELFAIADMAEKV